MKRAAALAALVPDGVVMVTSTAPAACAGVTAVAWVSETTVTVVLVPPKEAPVAPVRLVPVIVTLVPPAAGPLAGAIPVMVGAGMGAAS